MIQDVEILSFTGTSVFKIASQPNMVIAIDCSCGWLAIYIRVKSMYLYKGDTLWSCAFTVTVTI